ncbi:MAG: transporter substrate-binding domain-containing protein [Ruminococcaceae bacterium]|nr:transporter substrate-binding domain-containing protein [Oscillospiraceae bacterium]
MKLVKSIAIALVAVMTAALVAGCNSTPKEKLIMATNAAFPPYEFVGDDGEFAGIDVEIAGLIAEELGMELEIKDVSFGSILGGVQTNKYHIGMAGMTVTDERKEQVNFSNTYATAKQVVIVKADSEYASFEDFYTGYDEEENPAGVKEGIKIGVQENTTGDIYSSDEPANWGFGGDNVVRYKTGALAIEDLKKGRVTAVIIDNEPAKAFVEMNEGLKILDGAYADEEYAIAIAKENTELLDKVNAALEKLTDNGKIQEIVDKYIK